MYSLVMMNDQSLHEVVDVAFWADETDVAEANWHEYDVRSKETGTPIYKWMFKREFDSTLNACPHSQF